jgi:hypothetical protein
MRSFLPEVKSLVPVPNEVHRGSSAADEYWTYSGEVGQEISQASRQVREVQEAAA